MRGHVRELNELYQEVLLDHARPATQPTQDWKKQPPSAEGNNPLCGDRCTVYLDTGDGIIKDIGLRGLRAVRSCWRRHR